MLPANAQVAPDPLLKMLENSVAYKKGKHFIPTLELAISTAPERVQDLIRKALALAPDKEKEILALIAPEKAPEITLASGESVSERIATLNAPKPKLGFFSPKAWDGEVSLGGSLLTGNTSEKAISLGLKLDRNTELWEHHFSILGDYSRNEERTTKERVLANYNSKWFLWDRGYAFGLLDFELDSFSEFDWRVSEAIGAGYRVMERETMTWDLEGGPGLRETKLAANGVQTEVIAVARSIYNWHINSKLKFLDQASVFSGSKRTTFINDAGFTAKFTDQLSGRLSLYIKYDTSVPDGQENLDTATRASIVYDF
jgi:putative salt-induced outer membrane protein